MLVGVATQNPALLRHSLSLIPCWTSGQLGPKQARRACCRSARKKAGNGKTAVPHRLQHNKRRKPFQYAGKLPPHRVIALLQPLNFSLINAMPFRVSGNLRQIVDAAALQAYKLPRRGKVGADNVSVQQHLADKRAPVPGVCRLYPCLQSLHFFAAEHNMQAAASDSLCDKTTSFPASAIRRDVCKLCPKHKRKGVYASAWRCKAGTPHNQGVSQVKFGTISPCFCACSACACARPPVAPPSGSHPSNTPCW